MAVKYPKSSDIQDAVCVGAWGDSDIPVYDVPNMQTLNQLVGYVKHINAGEGTVLYRGQCRLYEAVIPSIQHDMGSYAVNKMRLDESIAAIERAPEALRFCGLRRPEIEGWRLYQRLVLEAILQHYGACTHSVDFVDNHWTALWFGLNAWNGADRKYIRRTDTCTGEPDAPIKWNDNVAHKPFPLEPTMATISLPNERIEELREDASHCTVSLDELIQRNKLRLFAKVHGRWEKDCAEVEDYNQQIEAREKTDHLYLFLYVAETNGSYLNGVYLGENCYTTDLRKALPSTFLRPCAQHGWIVKGKNEDYQFNQNIACVVRVSVALADKMLGRGTLLSQENFFPDETIDQGYKILLERQEGSRLASRFAKLLPAGMITDFG